MKGTCYVVTSANAGRIFLAFKSCYLGSTRYHLFIRSPCQHWVSGSVRYVKTGKLTLRPSTLQDHANGSGCKSMFSPF